MALSRIPLTPNMDATTMISAINQNLQQIEAENRSKVIRDENGIDRIILGQMPDGTYGLIVSKPGKDVKELFIDEA